ncbi:MAG TPA: hypothetical protein VME46_16165 [Acidimicrobiales bacterium]|nr:hypothetical protein [Acidimicrobiales bacterium]
MRAHLVAATDVLAVEVTVVATLVVVALLASLLYLLRSVRDLRRQAWQLSREARELMDDLDATVSQASAEVERVERIVGSAEAISEAVSTASRLVGGIVTEPLIKLVAFGSGAARAARALRRGRPHREIPAVARENARARSQAASRSVGGAARRSGPLAPPPRRLLGARRHANRAVPGAPGAVAGTARPGPPGKRAS